MNKVNKTITLNSLRGFILFYYLVGVTGLSLPPTRELFIGLIPFSLLASTILTLFFHKSWTKKFILAVILIYLSGFGIEALGVNTGLIFGHYTYGPALGIQFWDTPLLIGVNWLLLLYCIYQLLPSGLGMLPASLAAATLMVLYDFLLEPVAIHYHWWTWDTVTVPLQNYLAWFLIAALLYALLHALHPKTHSGEGESRTLGFSGLWRLIVDGISHPKQRFQGRHALSGNSAKNPIAAWVLLAQVVFMLVLNLIHL